MAFPTILRVTEISYSPRLAPGGKTGNDVSESSRLEFLGKFQQSQWNLRQQHDQNFPMEGKAL